MKIDWNKVFTIGAQFGLPGLAVVLIMAAIISMLAKPEFLKDRLIQGIFLVGLFMLIALSLFFNYMKPWKDHPNSEISNLTSGKTAGPQCPTATNGSDEVKLCKQQLDDLSTKSISPDCPFPKKSAVRAYFDKDGKNGYVDIGDVWVKCPAYNPRRYRAYTANLDQSYFILTPINKEKDAFKRIPTTGGVTMYGNSPNGPWSDAELDVLPISK